MLLLGVREQGDRRAVGPMAVSVNSRTQELLATRAHLLGTRVGAGPSLFEGEVHLVVDHLALRVEALEDLGKHIHCLLAAQPRLLGLELLQQVLGGHGLPCQVAAHSILSHLYIPEEPRGDWGGEWEALPASKPHPAPAVLANLPAAGGGLPRLGLRGGLPRQALGPSVQPQPLGCRRLICPLSCGSRGRAK